jgi:hypothetical protein
MNRLGIHRPRRQNLWIAAMPEVGQVAFFTAMAYVLTWAKPYVITAFEFGIYGHLTTFLLSHICLLILMARSTAIVAAGVKLRLTLHANRRNAGKRT